MRVAAFAVTVTLLFASLSLGAAQAADRGVMQEKDTFRDAAMAPLEDLNLKQKGIPDVLLRARADPYDMEGLSRCEPIAGEIGRLDAALGPDLDEAPPPDTRTRAEKVGGAIKDAGISELRSESRSLLPFRGWVRKLTGAARHDKKVQAAIRAGEVRRGYLKGVGMRMNCAPPAAPSWFVPTPPQSVVEKVMGQSFDGLWARITAWLWSWWPF
ncbi:MAG TPA: hypothetical protein PKX06_00100 [Phenylobacterium sp.]|nr:hypothetical protein [Phenylobacterium sp.]